MPRRNNNNNRKQTKPAQNGAVKRNIQPTNPLKRQRTLASVQNQLARVPPSTSGAAAKGIFPAELMDYIHCRLNPFTSGNQTSGIPDGSSVKRIVVDHRFYVDVTIGSAGTAVFKTLPVLPCPLLVKPGSATVTGFTYNGFSWNTAAGTAGGADLSGGWASVGPIPEWTNFVSTVYPIAAPPPNTGALDPYLAIKARMVTQAMRITYTGQSQSCSGMLTCLQNDFGFDDSSVTLNEISAFLDIQAGSASTPLTVLAGTAWTGLIDARSIFGQITQDTVMIRPESGITVLTRHLGQSYRWRTVLPYGMLLIPSGPTPKAVYAFAANTANAYNGFVTWIDNEWASSEVQISGATSGTTFRAELIQCMEYEVSATSPFYKLSSMPSVVSTKAVEITQNVLNNAPIAAPNTFNFGSLVAKAMKGIGAAAATVAPMLGPKGMIIGTGLSALMSAMS